MSRSALWRQEGNKKEREERAELMFNEALEEGRSRSKSALSLWGPDDSFHWNPLLLRNTIQSPYFQKSCENLKTWNAVIDEIYYEVKHLQPFSVDKSPSTAFCLLLRLLTMRMTENQMELTLKHPDSPFIRGIGFLYLRYAGQPAELAKWIQPHLHDEQEITAETRKTTTVGEFVRELFSSRDYYGTPLPRLPIQIERDVKLWIMQAEKACERAAQHYKNQERMRLFQTLGSRVMALYGDDENPLAWYEGVVDRVVTTDEASGYALKYPNFVVTFTEYGNTETVKLGEMDVTNGNWRHDKVGGQDFEQEIRQKERDTVTSEHRGGWARRPPTTKNSLSQVGGPRKDSHYSHDRQRPPPQRQPPRHQHHQQQQQHQAPNASAPPPPEQRKRSAEEMAVIADKKRRLMAKYG
jgi:pre-mRNA-splicing factor 38B